MGINMKNTIIITMLVLLAACSDQQFTKASKTITIGAAASLKDAMTELKDSYMKAHPDTDIKLSFAATGTLRTQIEKGAPIDIFASANATFGCKSGSYDSVVKAATVKVMCYNALVLIKNSSLDTSGKGMDALILSDKVKKIAIGNPDFVPAGKYAKALLEEKGLWQKVKPNLVYASNVRQVLSWLEQNVADYGFVYKTDAATSKQVKILAEFMEINGKKLIYPIALTNQVRNEKEAQTFIDFVLSEKGQGILEKHCFVTGK